MVTPVLVIASHLALPTKSVPDLYGAHPVFVAAKPLPEFPDRTIVVAQQHAEQAQQAAVEATQAAEAQRQAEVAAEQAKVVPVAPTVVTGADTGDVWSRIRQCESTNNYANKNNPNYRGAYQFSFATWASVGGSGDPADASPLEQDMRAQMLQARSGWSQWECAGKLGIY